MLYMIPLLLLLNILAAFMFEDLVWIITAMFFAYRRICADDGKDNLNLPKENNN